MKNIRDEVKQFSLSFQDNYAILQGEEPSETFTSSSKTLTLNAKNYCSIACDIIPVGYTIELGSTMSLIVEQISDDNIFILNKGSTLDFCVKSSSYRIQSSKDRLLATKIVNKVEIAEFIIANFDEGAEKCVSLDQNKYLILYNEYKNDDVFRDIFGYLSDDKYVAMINADIYSANNWSVIVGNQQDVYEESFESNDDASDDDYGGITKSLKKVDLSSQKDETTQSAEQDSSDQMKMDEENMISIGQCNDNHN